jgi:2-dehydropantoate 2-reductase
MESKDGSALRIASLGAGAMGSIFGAELTSNGVDTLLVDVDGPLINRLNDSGVIIRRAGKERQICVRATHDPLSEGPVDVLLVFVKCWATREAMALAQPLLGSKTCALAPERMGQW